MPTPCLVRKIPAGKHVVALSFFKDDRGVFQLDRSGVRCESYEHMGDFVAVPSHIAPECRGALWHVVARMCLRLRGDDRVEGYFREA